MVAMREMRRRWWRINCTRLTQPPKKKRRKKNKSDALFVISPSFLAIRQRCLSVCLSVSLMQARQARGGWVRGRRRRYVLPREVI